MIVISHRSAFLYWRHFRGTVASLKRVHRASLSVKAAAKLEDYTAELVHLGILATEKRRLDLLFFCKESRIQGKLIHPHVTAKTPPAGALIQLTPQVAIVSPEYCFLQLAQEWSPARAALAGMELCATYGLDEDEKRFSRTPLTTAAAIIALAKVLQPQGTGRASLAANYLMDRADSPMEAKLALLLCLPTSLGGYDISRPVLNAPISLSPAAKALYPHETCRADLYWPHVKLDVEYDGEDAHTGSMHAKDVARAAALKADGVEVLALAAPQLHDRQAFEEVAKLIAARVGHPLRIRRKNFSELNAQLRQELGL